MRDLNHDFKLLRQRNRDGSMATQHDREVILSLGGGPTARGCADSHAAHDALGWPQCRQMKVAGDWADAAASLASD